MKTRLGALSSFRIDQFRDVAVIIATLLFAVWLGQQIGTGRLSVGIAAAMLGSILLLLLFLGQSFRRNLLVLSFGGLILGWRGLEVTSGFYIYPSEFFIWIGFALCLANAAVVHRQGLLSSLPLAAHLLAAFALTGLLVSVARSMSLELALKQATTFVVFVPLFVLLRQWVSSVEDIYLYVHVLVVAGAIVASLGLLERYAPSLSANMSWLFTHPIQIRSNFYAGGTVELAGFGSWGTPVVTVILVPIVGLWTVMMKQATGIRKWPWAAVGIILVAGIMVAGYRSAWLGLIATLVMLLFIQRKSFGFLMLGGAILIWWLPQQFINRFDTILLLEQSGDQTILRRLTAFDSGVQSAIQSPLWGTGWGSPTPYNDWLYVAVSMGIPALVIFVYWYVGLLRKLSRKTRPSFSLWKGSDSQLGIGFLAGLVGFAVSMFSGAMTNVTPLATSFWLIFCLALRFTELENRVDSSVSNSDPDRVMNRLSRSATKTWLSTRISRTKLL